MGIQHEFIRHQPQQPLFNFVHILAGCDAGAVGYPEDMGIHGNGGLAKGGIEDHIGGLAADTGQCLQCGTLLRDLAVMLLNQAGAGLDNVAGLGVEQANRFYVLLEAGFTQLQHGTWCPDLFKQWPGGLVHPDVGGLGRQDDGDQQLEGITVLQFGGGFRIGSTQSCKDLLALVAVHSSVCGHYACAG